MTSPHPDDANATRARWVTSPKPHNPSPMLMDRVAGISQKLTAVSPPVNKSTMCKIRMPAKTSAKSTPTLTRTAFLIPWVRLLPFSFPNSGDLPPTTGLPSAGAHEPLAIPEGRSSRSLFAAPIVTCDDVPFAGRSANSCRCLCDREESGCAAESAHANGLPDPAGSASYLGFK